AAPAPVGSWAVAIGSAAVGIILPRLLRFGPARLCLAALQALFAAVVLFPRIPLDFSFLLAYATPWIWLSLVGVRDRGFVFARTLHDAPDTFVATDGFYSLYFWTDKEPPSPILITHSMSLYDTERQAALTDAVLSRPRLLLILNPTIPELRDELAAPFYQNL